MAQVEEVLPAASPEQGEAGEGDGAVGPRLLPGVVRVSCVQDLPRFDMPLLLGNFRYGTAPAAFTSFLTGQVSFLGLSSAPIEATHSHHVSNTRLLTYYGIPSRATPPGRPHATPSRCRTRASATCWPPPPTWRTAHRYGTVRQTIGFWHVPSTCLLALVSATLVYAPGKTDPSQLHAAFFGTVKARSHMQCTCGHQPLHCPYTPM